MNPKIVDSLALPSRKLARIPSGCGYLGVDRDRVAGTAYALGLSQNKANSFLSDWANYKFLRAGNPGNRYRGRKD
jgi:hypothetical protein